MLYFLSSAIIGHSKYYVRNTRSVLFFKQFMVLIVQLQVEEIYELCVLRIVHDAMKAKDIYNLHLREHSKEQNQESHGKDRDCLAVLQKTELVPVE